MDIRFVELHKKSAEYKKVTALYFSAFPLYERLPLFILNRKTKSGNAKFYNVFDGEQWVGFNYLIIGKGMAMLQYLAIDANVRSKGYGRMILEKIKNIYPDCTIVLLAEKPDEKSKNNEDRIRRKNFYLNNGFRESGYYAGQKFAAFEMLFCGKRFSIEEVFELCELYTGKLLWKMLYPLVRNKIKRDR
ncbi:MAG: GNAT family N-acetyltransferase [Treponema sp.]|nr:GNAT family N-acetyltransferase [Treponema sp.]